MKDQRAYDQARVDLRKLVYRFFYGLSIVVLVFFLFLVIDDLSPAKQYHETAIRGWQKVGGSRSHGTAYVISYMRTENFEFRAPDEILIDYPYYDEVKPTLTITLTPFLQSVKSVEVTMQYGVVFWRPNEGMYSLGFAGIYVMFLATLLVLITARRYSEYSYWMAFFPFFCLVILIFIAS